MSHLPVAVFTGMTYLGTAMRISDDVRQAVISEEQRRRAKLRWSKADEATKLAQGAVLKRGRAQRRAKKGGKA